MTLSPKDHTKPVPHIWDLAALGLSAMCLIHCLALPVLAAFAPVVSEMFGGEYVHQILVLLAVPTSVYALKPWRKLKPIALLFTTLGLIGLGVGAFVHISERSEMIISVAGAIFVSMGHLINLFAKPLSLRFLPSS